MSIGIRNLISIYDKVYNLESKEVIPLDIFFENIRNGKWQDIAIPIRSIQDKEQREALKKKAPSVTISGKFIKREDNAIDQHSGHIGIDIDNIEGDINAVKERLIADRYVVAAFQSISGRGLCLVFKIHPEKHREAFQGISEYVFGQYKIICDPTSINVSRPRFVSFDPDIYVNEHADKFTTYPKSKPPKKIDKVIYSQDDFHSVLNQLIEKRLNIAEDYHTWLRIGFALVHKFGEQGREYFHIISQYSSKYESSSCDRQYTACLKHKGNNETTISTFYYHCKNLGLEIYSERTRRIAYSASQGKKAGLNADQVAENLSKFEEIVGEDVKDIIQQVMQNNIEFNDDTLIDQLELWMRQNYNLQRNEITRYIENEGVVIQQKDLNSIYIKAKKILERITYELIDRLINSDFVPTYNPFHRYFAERTGEQQEQLILELKATLLQDAEKLYDAKNTPVPALIKLFSTIATKDSRFAVYFGVKWFVGAISAIHGEHSPLMYVLSGDVQNTGKTEWCRRLLPKDLRHYYAESKLDAGKDDEILMTQKWFIMDDEMGGKSKKEVKRLKELTSKQTFSLREPYGRNNVDLNRLAVLMGTTNDNEILSDPTGNRRIIPVHVYSIDQAAYNSINKEDLFMEAWCLYKAGFNWKLNRSDIEYLGKDSEFFEMTVSEAELIQKYYEPGEQMLTATDIKVFLEKHTQQKLILGRLGQELKRLGFVQKHVKTPTGTKRVYMAQNIAGMVAETKTFQPPRHNDDDVPF